MMKLLDVIIIFFWGIVSYILIIEFGWYSPEGLNKIRSSDDHMLLALNTFHNMWGVLIAYGYLKLKIFISERI